VPDSATVSVLAQCGGGATFMRTVVKYPQRFARAHHWLNNCVTGEWEQVGPFARAVGPLRVLFRADIAARAASFACLRASHAACFVVLRQTLEATLKQHDCRLCVTWCEDKDHTKRCVSYKS
jgi:hypothetical protein